MRGTLFLACAFILGACAKTHSHPTGTRPPTAAGKQSTAPSTAPTPMTSPAPSGASSTRAPTTQHPQSSRSEWRCSGRGETERITTRVAEVFYNDNYDDGGRRTELMWRWNATEHRHSLEGDVRPMVKQGRQYTFVLRPRTWHDEEQLHLVGLLDGARVLYRYDHRYLVNSKIVLDRTRQLLEYDHGSKRVRLPVPGPVLELGLDPDTRYSITVHDREDEGAFCSRLEAIAVPDPSRTETHFDEMLGPYEVPALRTLWESAE